MDNSGPDTHNIVAIVYFEGGSHGFEEPYESGRSTEDYLKYFEDQCNMENGTNTSRVLWLELTEHDENGSWRRDEKGNRLMKRIYFDDQLGGRLFPG